MEAVAISTRRLTVLAVKFHWLHNTVLGQSQLISDMNVSPCYIWRRWLQQGAVKCDDVVRNVSHCKPASLLASVTAVKFTYLEILFTTNVHGRRVDNSSLTQM